MFSMEDQRWGRLALLMWSAGVLAMAGCGGGGGGGAGATAPSPDGISSAAPAAAPAPVPAALAPAAAPAPLSAPVESATPAVTAAAAPTLGDCELFPPAAIFNTRIDDTARFPAHANSAAWVALVGGSVPFWADWGFHANPADYTSYYGLPINIVDGTAATTEWPLLSFDFSTSGISTERGYPHESDCAVAGGGGFGIARNCSTVPVNQARFPFPLASKVLNSGGDCNDPNTCGDHSLLIVEKGACRLWESYFAYRLSGQWYAMSTAAWDLKSLALRPAGWTSSSASGLPITPLVAKAAEASSGEIRHALAVNFRDQALARASVWPARHFAGGDNPGAIPFGALLRLKADFVIPPDWTPQARALATAAKRYGLYAADNGADFYVQGEPSASWDLLTSIQLKTIKMSNMEFVNLKSVTSDPRFSPDSMAASW
jgi:hypothetical protein